MAVRMNETFRAAALFSCDHFKELKASYLHDPYWRQTYVGCMVLGILQNIYKFNLYYVVEGPDSNLTENEKRNIVNPRFNDSIDIYVKPIGFSANLLDNAWPVQAIFNWRFGFLLRKDYRDVFKRFYSIPFSGSVWFSISFMIIFSSFVFYCTSWWEARLVGSDNSFIYEIFLAFSAVCQHILPLRAILYSRRIAYVSFIMGAYVVHCFYTSNLLSHLVSDKDGSLNLEELAESDYEIALLKDMNLSTGSKLHEVPLEKNISIILNKLKHVKTLHLVHAVNAVMCGKTALLTDYITVYPIMKKMFTSNAICQLIEIDIYSNMKHYLFTSKKFPYKEEFKIGILRLKETGILKRLIATELYTPFLCEDDLKYVITGDQLYVPIVALFVSFFLGFLILLGERIHYKINKRWPYQN